MIDMTLVVHYKALVLLYHAYINSILSTTPHKYHTNNNPFYLYDMQSEVSQASLSRISMQPTLQPKGHPRSILQYSDPYAAFSAPEVAVQVSVGLSLGLG